MSTYTLIQSQTLVSSAASVTFSTIPSTYTDLVLKVSARSDRADGNNNTIGQIQLNGTTANYSDTLLYGNGSSPGSTYDSNFSYIPANYMNSNSSTSNTFSSMDFYIPSYTVSQNKPLSVFMAQEINGTTAWLNSTAGLWRNTAAITSLTFSFNGYNVLSGSSFYLYGISSS